MSQRASKRKSLACYILQVLAGNAGRWMSTSEIASQMPRRIANTPRVIACELRIICAEKVDGVERTVDPVTGRRYYRYTEGDGS